MHYRVHHPEIFPFREIFLRPSSHILNLSLLFTHGSEVAKHDFELSHVPKLSELLNGLSFECPFLIPVPPESEGPLEDVDTLFLKDPHHLSLDVGLGLLGLVVVGQGLVGRRANLCVVEGVRVVVFTLLQGVNYEGPHDLHVSAETPEDTCAMTLRIFLHPISSIVHKCIEMFSI